MRPAVQVSGAIHHHDRLLELAPREAALLRALLAQPSQIVTKERLSSADFPGQTRVHIEAIEVVAYRLRRKLAGCGVQPMNLRGLGYLLREPR